ncbi:hypothetical protein CARUB_v10005994mg [Capsella rubella]|uniref:Uncharacterized protein n=1 Tax=Capsella rubella TaxID=81985 RepID=R0GL70_9BRAS|nr:hypothetical protein CARUB_v10005994mg [Capsella rubella]
MAPPKVINASGNPPHLLTTISASRRIVGDPKRSFLPTLSQKSSHAYCFSRKSTLNLQSAPITLHNAIDRVVNISLHLLSLLGRGTPVFCKSISSQASSSNNKNLFSFKALNIFKALCSPVSFSPQDKPNWAPTAC